MIVLKKFHEKGSLRYDTNTLLDYADYFEGEQDVYSSEVKLVKASEDKTDVTFLGHSTCLIKDDDRYFITDPVLRERIFWLKRKSPLGRTYEELPEISAILISHGHYDHLDLPSLRKFPLSTTIIIPKGLDKLVSRLGFSDIRVLEWWQKTEIKGTTITAVPVKHIEGRYPFFPNSQCQGYVIKKNNSVYFAGDTGYFEGFDVIGKHFSIDIALLPIGAYHPQIKYNHLRPEEAVQAFQMLMARHMIPIHWGAFRLSLESMEEPIERLKLRAKTVGLIHHMSILQPGEALTTI